jgi:hypothetical protein
MIEKIKNFVDIFFSRLAGWATLIFLIYFCITTFVRAMAPCHDPALVIGQGVSLFLAITAIIFFFFQQLGTHFYVPKKTAKKIEMISLYAVCFLYITSGLFVQKHLWAFWLMCLSTVLMYGMLFLRAFFDGATEGQI